MKILAQVRLVKSTPEQVRWGGNTDPSSLFSDGMEFFYSIKYHEWNRALDYMRRIERRSQQLLG